MNVYRIKGNYRYLLYEKEQKYFLVDTQDHFLLTLLFPICTWFLYHKVYELSEEAFTHFQVHKQKKADGVGSIVIASMALPFCRGIGKMVNGFSFHSSFEVRIWHLFILLAVFAVFLLFYIRKSKISCPPSIIKKIKIFPENVVMYLVGIFYNLMMLCFVFMIFSVPFAKESVLIMNGLFLVLSCLLLISNCLSSYYFLKNVGPYVGELQRLDGNI